MVNFNSAYVLCDKKKTQEFKNKDYLYNLKF